MIIKNLGTTTKTYGAFEVNSQQVNMDASLYVSPVNDVSMLPIDCE